MSRTALVTIAIGAEHHSLWHAYCKRNWEAYAERHGYDVICITEPLDRSARAAARSPAWQKCLILGQPFAERYDCVVWSDADVLFNPAAPPIDAAVTPGRVGAVDEYAIPTPELHRQALQSLYRHWEATGVSFERNDTAGDFHAAYGLPGHHPSAVHTGLMVLSPQHHRELLEDVYFGYKDRGGDLWGEWRPLSYELLEAGVVEWLDPRFNYSWPLYKALQFPFLLDDPGDPGARAAATAALRDVHCLHFSGGHREIALVEQDAPEHARRPRPRTAPADAGLRTPLALLLYARPETTSEVLRAVRAARPRRLLVVADAPPDDRPDLVESCDAVRRLIDEVDWECEISRNYAERHMGLNQRVATGLDWVFDQVDEAIVLEDDCVPHPTFFRFCEEMLARYRDETRVSTICGSCFDFGARDDGPSYRYSRYPLVWGWATWRRAWRARAPRVSRWPELRDARWLEQVFDDPHALAYWSGYFEQTHRGEGSWDYGWTLSSWVGESLAAVPRVNLVTNIGFGAEATHTRGNLLSPFEGLPTEAMRFPLTHPERLEPDETADRVLEQRLFSGNVSRLFTRLRATRERRAPATG